MTGDHGSRLPLWIQDPRLIKATGQQVNPSWESAQPHQRFVPQYKGMDDRPSTHAMATIRRNPDGTLDYEWAKNMVIDAVHNSAQPYALLPIHLALLTVMYPQRFRNMEPQQAEILTQFSPSEKDKVRQLVEAQLREEENWNAGLGGSSVEGRHVTRNGIG